MSTDSAAELLVERETILKKCLEQKALTPLLMVKSASLSGLAFSSISNVKIKPFSGKFDGSTVVLTKPCNGVSGSVLGMLKQFCATSTIVRNSPSYIMLRFKDCEETLQHFSNEAKVGWADAM